MKKFTRALALSAAAMIAGFGGSLGAVAQEAPPAPDAPAPEAPPAPDGPAPDNPEGNPDDKPEDHPEDNGDHNPDEHPEDKPAPEEHREGIGSESKLSEVSQKNLSDFGSCIASEKSADLLFVLDQSASLVGYEGSTPTDADFFRVDATTDIVKQLANLGEDNGADINVKLAGFGSEYYSDPAEYGGWTNVSGKEDALDSELEKFRQEDRVSDLETNYGAAYSGALKEFASHESSNCRAIVFFTDGKYYTDAEAHDLKGAQDKLCEVNSSVTAFRNSNIRLFNVGLVPAAEAQDQISQLTRMAEGEDCGQGAPNGAFFDAGEDPAALFAAFRNLIPTSGGVTKDGNLKDQFDFVLDDSVSPVRLSAVPKNSVDEGTLIPTLTGPNGEVVELHTDTTKVAGAKVSVTENNKLPGMVDIAMEKDGDDWAGAWTFGYKVAEGTDGEYLASVVMVPGLTLDLKREDGTKVEGGINSDQVLKGQLVDGKGEARTLEGEGTLHAEFVPEEGSPVTLVDNAPITDGQPVDIPLDQVENAASGQLVTRVDITTKGTEDRPGSKLDPINAETPLTITPVNMPTVGSAQTITMTEKEITVDVPVTGPGKVWVADQTVNTEDAMLPAGVSSIAVSSKNNSEDSALELSKDEKATIPVTLSVENMADGPLRVEPVINLQSAEDNQQMELPLTLQGSMSAPLSKSAFGLAFVLAVLLALLIPLAILYFMKWFSGRIPEKPRMFVKTIPVKRDGANLVRTDNGRPFAVSKDEFQGAVPVETSARSAQLGRNEAKVKMGLSPFTAAHVEIQRDGTISGKGKKSGYRAVLPLAIQNEWFFVGNQKDRDSGEIVLTVDTLAQASQYDEMSKEISRQALPLFDQVAFPAEKEPTPPPAGQQTPPQQPGGPSGPTGQPGPSAPQGPWGPQGGPQPRPLGAPYQGSQPHIPQRGGFGSSQPSGPSPQTPPQHGQPGRPNQPGQSGFGGGPGFGGGQGFGQPQRPNQPGGPGQPGGSGFGQPGQQRPNNPGTPGNNGGFPPNPGFGPRN